jgi:Fe2+ or Zn2+ uptake regulation protein
MKEPGGTELEARCAAFAQRCREQGVRVTAQRLAVYRALAEDRAHPTADAVHRRLRATMPSLSPATVYRILDALVTEGVLRRVSTTGGAGRFDANLAPHQHLVCRVCGRMVDVFASGVDVGRIAPDLPPGFVVEDVDVRIVGRCRTCSPGSAGLAGTGTVGTTSSQGARVRRDRARTEPA